MSDLDKNNWATGTLKEVPFWRDDMQPEEYDIEREYFHNVILKDKPIRQVCGSTTVV